MSQIQNILIIGFVWPEPNSSAAGTRMEQLLFLFNQWGWKVTYATPAMETDFMIDLAAIGVDKKAIKLNCSSFDEFVNELNPVSFEWKSEANGTGTKYGFIACATSLSIGVVAL